MEIIDKIEQVGNTIFETGKQVSGIVVEKAREAKSYAKDAVDIASLKNQIASCNDVIKSSYETLGEFYFKKYEEDPAAEVVESVRAVENAQATIKELEAKIQEIKDAQVEAKAARAAAAETDDEAEAAVDVDAEITPAEEPAAEESVDEELEQVKKDGDAE